ncbi:preprotein translocase subunit YajC [Nocardioides sp.]|uniref:preprotein translocase subunit YajC n=1 Tax=Nocardioides sp. TaxID=35761 RepID=UPI002720AF3A|nr:preprotein translocase subunit YajC [Nocardioides sp.]MDO9457454.1 preprotein translocase subunit YajC [Nocardioides sp.]
MEGLVPLLPIVGIFLVFWLLVIRPGVRRERDRRAMQSELVVGDAVILTSGFFGTIVALHDDRAEIELAPGTTVTVALGAVAGPQPESDTPTDSQTPDLHKTTNDSETSSASESEES